MNVYWFVFLLVNDFFLNYVNEMVVILKLTTLCRADRNIGTEA